LRDNKAKVWQEHRDKSNRMAKLEFGKQPGYGRGREGSRGKKRRAKGRREKGVGGFVHTGLQNFSH